MPLKSIGFLSLTVMSKPSGYMLFSPLTWFLSFSLSLFKWLFPDFLYFLSLQVLCHQHLTFKTSSSIGTVVILSFKNAANVLFCHICRQNWIGCGALIRVPLEACCHSNQIEWGMNMSELKASKPNVTQLERPAWQNVEYPMLLMIKWSIKVFGTF